MFRETEKSSQMFRIAVIMQEGSLSALAKAKAKYIAPIEEAELAVRICEAMNGMRRPPGSTAAQALDGMEPESRNVYRNAARAAMAYWKECIDAANRSQ